MQRLYYMPHPHMPHPHMPHPHMPHPHMPHPHATFTYNIYILHTTFVPHVLLLGPAALRPAALRPAALRPAALRPAALRPEDRRPARWGLRTAGLQGAKSVKWNFTEMSVTPALTQKFTKILQEKTRKPTIYIYIYITRSSLLVFGYTSNPRTPQFNFSFFLPD